MEAPRKKERTTIDKGYLWGGHHLLRTLVVTVTRHQSGVTLYHLRLGVRGDGSDMQAAKTEFRSHLSTLAGGFDWPSNTINKNRKEFRERLTKLIDYRPAYFHRD